MSTEYVPESPAPSPEVPLTKAFAVEPYRPDGGWSLGGAFQLIGCIGLAAVALGAIASYVSRYFYLIVLFSILIGFCIGFVGSFCIRRFGIRRPLVCGAAGFIGGVLSMLMMQYFDYRHFQSEMAAGFGEGLPAAQQVARNLEDILAQREQLPQDLREFVEDLEANPSAVKALKVDSFPSYVDFAATNGVRLSNRSGREDGGLNLGYVGTYIYWGVEMLIVAGVAYSIMKHSAAEPYCQECQTWKTAEVWGPLQGPQAVREAIDAGRLPQFPFDENPAPGPTTVVSGFRCENCRENGTIDVRVEELRTNKQGEVKRKTLTQATYPGDAWAALVIACCPIPPTPPEAAIEGAVEGEAGTAS